MEVQLDDDAPDTDAPADDGARVPPGDGAATAAAGPSARRRWPWALLVPAAALALVAAQGVADARERAQLDALATVPGVVAPLDGVARLAWQVDPATRLDGAVRVGSVLVAPAAAADHTVTLEGLDPATGARSWSVEVLGARPAWSPDALPDVPACAAVTDHPGQVVCVVTDGARDVAGADEFADAPATGARLLLLDATDGTVLADREVPLPVSDVVSAGDDVLLVGLEGTTLHVRSESLRDGTARFTTTDPRGWVTGTAPTATLLDRGTLAVDQGSMATLFSTSGGLLRAVDPGSSDALTGRTVETTVVMSPALGAVAVGNRGGTALATADGEVRLEGTPLPVTVDDGSVPGLVLTRTPRLQAWDAATGVPRWDTRIVDAQDATVLRGRVHVGTSSAVVTFDGETGAELWRVARPSATGTPVTDGRHLYVMGSRGGRHSRPYDLVAVHVADGSEAWRVSLPDGIGLTSVAGLLVTSGWDPDTRLGVLQVLR